MEPNEELSELPKICCLDIEEKSPITDELDVLEQMVETAVAIGNDNLAHVIIMPLLNELEDNNEMSEDRSIQMPQFELERIPLDSD